MNGLQCEWDRNKAEANRRKHGVSFEEAATVFDDPHAKEEYDGRHSHVEDRWLVVGLSDRLRLISLAYTRRDEAIRIIHARRATKAEARRYAGQA